MWRYLHIWINSDQFPEWREIQINLKSAGLGLNNQCIWQTCPGRDIKLLYNLLHSLVIRNNILCKKKTQQNFVWTDSDEMHWCNTVTNYARTKHAVKNIWLSPFLHVESFFYLDGKMTRNIPIRFCYYTIWWTAHAQIKMDRWNKQYKDCPLWQWNWKCISFEIGLVTKTLASLRVSKKSHRSERKTTRLLLLLLLVFVSYSKSWAVDRAKNAFSAFAWAIVCQWA